MSDAQRRAIRGLAQVTFVQALIQLYNAFAATDLTGDQVSAITVVATPIVVFIQNWLEDNVERVPAFGKAPTSPGLNPVPEAPRKLETPPKA